MTLLDLAKRCNTTIQSVANAIETVFSDKLSISTNTHVPDKYVGHIISLYAPTITKDDEGRKKQNKKLSPVQTFGNGEGSLYKLRELANDLNVSVQSIVEQYNHIFKGNSNPNSRVSEDLANAIMIYFGKEYLIKTPRIEKQPKLKARNKEKREAIGNLKEPSSQKKQSRISKQQLANEFDQIKMGQVIDAVVSRVEETFILVEFGNLRGIINKNNLFWSNVKRISHYWNVGAPITAKVISKEIVDGKFNIRLSHKACIPNVWEELDFEVNENGFHETEEASFVEVNDYGVVISIAYDMEGFLPLSEMSYEEFLFFQKEEPSNELIAVFIKNYDAQNKKLILTRQPYYDEQWKSVETRYIPGNTYPVQVIGKTDDRIWVKFDDDVESCIDKSEFAWEKTGSGNLCFSIGDSINVLVKSINIEKHKIYASIKELTPDPWILADENIKGQDIEVKVVEINEDRFIRVETLDNLHLIGTIRLSEVSWQYSSIELPKSMIPKIGETIIARVIVFDKDMRRLSFSIRQLIPDPWSNMQCGVSVRGKIGKLISIGVVEVILENGLKAITNEIELLSLNDDYIDFKVSDYSRQTKVIKVSHSQLQYDNLNESIIMSFFGNSKI